MSIGTIILIILILMLVGALPSWSHSKSWGYAKWRVRFSGNCAYCIAVNG